LHGNEKAYFRVSRAVNDTTGKTRTQRAAGKRLLALIGTSNREVGTAQQKQRDLNEAMRKRKKPINQLKTEVSGLSKRHRRLKDAVESVPANPTIAWKTDGFADAMAKAKKLGNKIADVTADIFGGVFGSNKVGDNWADRVAKAGRDAIAGRAT